jgi:hypothetical protein
VEMTLQEIYLEFRTAREARLFYELAARIR